VQAKLYQLEDLGIGLAIDDFGTGFSSLAYLQHFPLHRLKIDRSFIHDMAKDPTARGIVRSVTELGHNLAMRVVAEGVETLEQANFLRQIDCDEAQGYYFARPMPADATTAFLQRVTPTDSR
jgi:EAL domain-containing protein (putative c-di-GMP-specific phosphodiesterase class I)